MEQQDVGADTPLYELDILNVPNIVIALGSSRTNDTDDTIVNYPIYLVKDEEVSSQIGLYELKASQIPSVLDGDGDVDIDLLDNPLLYSFVNETFLKGARGESEKLQKSKDFTSSEKIPKREESEEGEQSEEEDSEAEEEAAVKSTKQDTDSEDDEDEEDEEEILDSKISQNETNSTSRNQDKKDSEG